MTSLKSGLAIIDQHRAHVRILFDQYLSNIRQQQGVSQQVLFPEIVEFTAAEAVVLPSLLEDLRFVGFDLSNLGNDNYAINGLPAGIENLDPVNLVKDIVDRAIETGCEVHEKICEAIALSLAKAAAIRPGKSLSSEEMDHLIASLFSCPDSNLTPDGKTIISMLSAAYTFMCAGTLVMFVGGIFWKRPQRPAQLPVPSQACYLLSSTNIAECSFRSPLFSRFCRP